MPRRSRSISSSGIYHIILRSVNKHIIFEEESDYQKFLYIISDCKSKFDIDIYAYCLMDNHIHMLLYAPSEQLAQFFKSFGARFVLWYNQKYSRSGHLFQDRFHSVAVESVSQYLATLVYIHNNPVKAAVCRFPAEYRWSSYKAFYGEKNPIINMEFSCEVAGSRESLLDFFASNQITSDEEFFAGIHQTPRQFLSDEKALALFKEITHLTSSSDVVNLPKRVRNDYIVALRSRGLTIKQVARLMDVSIATIKRVCSYEG